ncbi:hypothetical protein [Desulfosporosinus sp. BG]|uniref:hypothetical protein n=1 Tax=Desulfosporosinus sp. BG TaxID=1633135 RepID=UPI00083A23B4|nr:hypothetical protein [Desulfosporosinus sp. BG]ODA42530.1 hypothetical protein DSBG_0670 [Desulfosporosinus sp. BG]
MAGRKTSDLWQDFRFLTKEMEKFLIKQDMQLFYDLLSQRERLQTIIDQTADDGYKDSPEGQRVLNEIQQDSQSVISKLQLRMCVSKRQHHVREAYSGGSPTVLSRMNWQR